MTSCESETATPTITVLAEDLLPGDKLRRNFDDADGYTLTGFFTDESGRAWWNVAAPYGLTTLPDSQIRGCFHKDQSRGVAR